MPIDSALGKGYFYLFFLKNYSLPSAHYRALDKVVLFFFYIFFAECHITALGKVLIFFVLGSKLFFFYLHIILTYMLNFSIFLDIFDIYL